MDARHESGRSFTIQRTYGSHRGVIGHPRLGVGITWIIFPFVLMNALREMFAVLKTSAQELNRIHQLVSDIRFWTEPRPKPTPPPAPAAPDPPVLWSCRCQMCSKELEFVPERKGETITCPHCGVETELYRSSR